MKQNLDLKPLLRFFEVLPKSGDTELALLKSHLVIEEVLTKVITKAVKHEKYLHEARLSFNQKCQLARSIDDIRHSSWVWQAIKLLNSARNELSHNLTPDQLQNKLKRFTAHVMSNNPELAKVENNKKFTDFHMAAAATYLVVATAAHFDPANVRIPTLLTGREA